MQSKFLLVLELGEVMPAGSTTAVHVDVRQSANWPTNKGLPHRAGPFHFCVPGKPEIATISRGVSGTPEELPGVSAKRATPGKGR